MDKDSWLHEYTEFVTREKVRCYLVHFVAPHFLLVWKDGRREPGWNSYECKGINVDDVTIDVLKEIKVWDSIPDNVQLRLQNFNDQLNAEYREKMSRRGRKKKYPDFPSEIVCSSCSKKKKIASSKLANILEGKSLSLEDYLKVYKCRACRSSAPNPAYANLPVEFECIKCKKSVKISPSALIKRLERLGMTVANFVKDFHCQSCRPSKGRPPNPKYAHLPSELVCIQCDATMKCSPSQIVQRAKGKKMTPEEFIKQYRCQECFPTRGKKKKLSTE